jgi:hypothetical protein
MVKKKEYKVSEIRAHAQYVLSLIDKGWRTLADLSFNIKGGTESFEEITDEKGIFNGPSLDKGKYIILSKPSEEEWVEEIEDEEYPENPGTLPCLELREGSEEGQGPLRKNDSRRGQVEHLQLMLLELGYDLENSGSLNEINEVFDDETEGAVKAFQQENKDYDGEQLAADGVVDEKTADALNRMLVGLWYDNYETPSELTPEYRLIATTQEYAVKAGIEF